MLQKNQGGHETTNMQSAPPELRHVPISKATLQTALDPPKPPLCRMFLSCSHLDILFLAAVIVNASVRGRRITRLRLFVHDLLHSASVDAGGHGLCTRSNLFVDAKTPTHATISITFATCLCTTASI